MKALLLFVALVCGICLLVKADIRQCEERGGTMLWGPEGQTMCVVERWWSA